MAGLGGNAAGNWCWTGIPEDHRDAFSGSSTHRSEVGLDDLKGLSQPSKSWDSVLVHRDALTWRRERRNLRLSYGELISV